MAKPRVHELAKELDPSGKKITSKMILAWLKDQGEFVKAASSAVEPPVARRVREHFASQPSPAKGGAGKGGARKPAPAGGPPPRRRGPPDPEAPQAGRRPAGGPPPRRRGSVGCEPSDPEGPAAAPVRRAWQAVRTHTGSAARLDPRPPSRRPASGQQSFRHIPGHAPPRRSRPNRRAGRRGEPASG